MKTAALQLADSPTAQDLALETKIMNELRAAYAARDRGEHVEARAHMAKMAELIGMRSAGQVRRMEVERGLR